MKIAFYKGTGTIFDKLIRFWTSGPYSHCELLTDYGTGWSSSFRDKGIRERWIDFTSYKWDIVEIDTTLEQYGAALEWFHTHNRTPYDLLGLLGFLIRPQRGNSRQYFCSEAVAAALGFKDPWRFCPNTLYVALLRLAK